MQGKTTLGRAGNSAKRIAVPPFTVLGLNSPWLGEAASVVTMARLSREDGVSVLERGELTLLIDELKRNKEPDPKTLAATGKLLGAQELLIGTLIAAGSDRYRMYIRPVRVEDGVSHRTAEREIRTDHWADDLEEALNEMTAELLDGRDRRAPPSVVPMTRANLELAARARALQYQGDLLAAEPLYERALVTPTSAWGLEADYLRLMNDLGMREYASERAWSVIARMPEGGEAMCDRARLQLEASRFQQKIDEVREGVRLAASCGDPIVEAVALRLYAGALSDVDYGASQAAYRRALSVLPTKNGEYERAMVEYGLYRAQHLDGLAERGVPSELYAALAKRLEASGNLFGAAWAYHSAGSFAMFADQRKALLSRGLAAGKRVGGDVYDSLRLKQAELFREQGLPSKADETVLKIMGERLTAITKLAGGLPSTERRLDNDLLTAAGVKDLKRVAPGVAQEVKLLVRAHRIALASALRAWADRTAPESTRQADAYRAISSELDPSKATPPQDETPAQRFDRILKDNSLPLPELQRRDEPPLRGSVSNLSTVVDAIWDRFGSLSKEKASQAERRQMVEMLSKVASWSGAPRLLGNGYRLAARLALDERQSQVAREALAKARSQTTDAPWFENETMRLEVQAEEDPVKQRELRKKRTAIARRVALNDWIDALADAGNENMKTDHAGCIPDVERLLDVAKELEGKGAIEPAARAMAHAGTLVNACKNAEGSSQGVAIMDQRSKLLDKLSDPLRSLQGLSDTLDAYVDWQRDGFRGGVAAQIRRDLVANRLVRDIRAGAEALAEAGRYRDAVRVAATVTPHGAGSKALLIEAVEWSKHFQESAEYAPLVAGIHRQLSSAMEETHAQVRELTSARELYAKAKYWTRALSVQSDIMSRYSSGSLLIREFEKCSILATNDPANLDSCYTGLGSAVINRNATNLKSQSKLKTYVQQAMAHMPTWQNYLIGYTMDLKTHIANLALLAGDKPAFEKMNREVRLYYTETAPSRYMWATYLSRIAFAASEVDVNQYFAIYHDFEEARGASPSWRAETYVDVAETARVVGNRNEERFFLELGKAAARESPENRHLYLRYGADLQLAAGRWTTAAKQYEDAAKTLTAHPIKVENYAYAAAVATAMGGDLLSARAKLRPVLERIESQASSRSPCFDSLVLETAAALAGAAHDCNDFEARLKRAALQRTQCVSVTVLDDHQYTDRPSDVEYRAAGKCGSAFVPNATRLPGVAPDAETKIYEFSCAKGDLSACQDLAWTRRTRGVAADTLAAATSFKKNCQAGHQESCADLGDMMLDGLTGERDDTRAYELIRIACDSGRKSACLRQAELLRAGTGAPKDEALAVDRLGRACNLGSSSGCEQWIEQGGQQ